MLEKRVLHRLFSLGGETPFKVIFLGQTSGIYGDGVPNSCLIIRDHDALHLLGDLDDGLPEAYMDGKHIFPGAYLPTVPTLLGHLTSRNLWILDVENLRPHCRLTRDHWSERFQKNADTIRLKYGEHFVRMWRFYLRSCSANFRAGTAEVHQVLVSNGTSAAVPSTRNDVDSNSLGGE